MRFENLSDDKQLDFLRRIYCKLNNICFDGKLRGIPVYIESAPDGIDAAGFFHRKYYGCIGDEDYIALTDVFVRESVIPCKYQWHQVAMIATVLLHEMIHEYCRENRIDDSDHNERWQEESKKRGLISVYVNGISDGNEHINSVLLSMIQDTRIR